MELLADKSRGMLGVFTVESELTSASQLVWGRNQKYKKKGKFSESFGNELSFGNEF